MAAAAALANHTAATRSVAAAMQAREATGRLPPTGYLPSSYRYSTNDITAPS